jgi:uncharacterized Zn finger protein
MKPGRPCPFCGTPEVKVIVADKKTAEGIPTIISCTECGASTKPVYCTEDSYKNVVLEWLHGSIYSNSYMKKIKH